MAKGKTRAPDLFVVPATPEAMTRAPFGATLSDAEVAAERRAWERSAESRSADKVARVLSGPSVLLPDGTVDCRPARLRGKP